MFGIDMGPSGQENTQLGTLSSASGVATNQGEGDISASDQFMRAILSGDATKTSQALAPQIPATVTQLQAQLALPVKRPAHVQRIQVLQDRQILTRRRFRPRRIFGQTIAVDP